VTTPAPVPVEERAPQLPTSFSPSSIRSRIAEAERLMKTRPQPTALTSPSIEFVTMAAVDRATSLIHLFTVSKQTFLTKNSDLSLISSQGMPVDLHILRANGVDVGKMDFLGSINFVDVA